MYRSPLSANWIVLLSLCRRIDVSNMFFDWTSKNGRSDIVVVDGAEVVGGLDAKKLRTKTLIVNAIGFPGFIPVQV